MMDALWSRLTSIRGRLVVWYLGVLAVLLFGLCLMQTVTLRDYLRSTTAANMAQAAQSELAAVGPCFVTSPADLHRRAQALARLLGSDTVGTSIVTRTGRILAAHPFGPSGTTERLALSVADTRQAIDSAPIGKAVPSPGDGSSSCATASFSQAVHPPSVRSSGLLLMAIPLGPARHPVGYAILGHSMAAEDATLLHVRLTLWIGASILLLIAAIVALPIINRALRPLRRVTGTAEAIAAGDLAQRANLTPAIDEIGRLGNAFDTMVDRLQSALATTRASEERMRHFMADASHELRTPLTVLRGTSQVLLRQRELTQDEVDAAVSAIHDEAARLSRLVDDLLTLSRLDAGGALDPHPVVISSFLEQFLDRYSSAWPSRPISIDVGSLNGTKAQVDPEALRRILTNLVDNAARYSTAGKPIAITGELTSNTVSIAVRDAGPGLRREDAERVFERFYRANKSRSRLSGGSGLGLAIVHALVQQSRGTIRIDTAPDRGTTVAITLPRPGERTTAVVG
jgi:two-component system OmpR family sensor kinase